MLLLSRRRVLQRLAALSVFPLASGCGSSQPLAGFDLPGAPGTARGRFLHGVASGDPLADRVILWTRVTPAPGHDGSPLPLRWRVATDPAMQQLTHAGQAFTDAERDWTLKLDVIGLEPGKTYFYDFELDGERSPTGRTRTAAEGPLDRLRLAVVTCSDWARGLFNAYDRLAERDDLDAVIHLGDYIYENGRTNRFRPQEPPRECRSLEDYRLRWANHRTDAGLQEVHRKNPWIWVWDDHESCDGAWRDGADPSNHDEAEDGPWPLRKAAAMQAAHEWMPIRTPDPANLALIYRAFRFGDLADLLMLETRLLARDRQGEENTVFGDNLPAFTQTGVFADPSRHMLGAEQERWLAERLGESRARWRLIGNPTVFSPIKLVGLPRALGGGVFANPDQWDGYAPARDRVADMIQGSAGNVVILTGDVHAGLAFDVTLDPNNPLAYDPISQRGAIAVELVTPSISSAGDPRPPSSLEERLENLVINNAGLLRLVNPHARYVQTVLNGYLLLTLTPERCLAEFWTVPTVEAVTAEQRRDAVFEIRDGDPRLRPVNA